MTDHDASHHISELKLSIKQLQDSKILSKESSPLVVQEFIHLEENINDIVREIRRFRNRFAPINSLPDEILSVVFSLSLSEDVTTRGASQIAAVCHRWRSAALSHATIWSKIYISSASSIALGQASECFIRSKGAPMMLTISVPEVSLEFATLVFEHSSRIRCLSIRTSHDTLTQIAVAPLSMPILEALEVSSIRGETSDSDVLPVFFSDASAIKHLTLEMYNSWPAGVFENLTSLHLRCSRSFEMTFQRFVLVLQRNPRLQSLIMDRCSPVYTDEFPNPGVAQLPCLNEIVLKKCDAWLILSHIITKANQITIEDYMVFCHQFRGVTRMEPFGGTHQTLSRHQDSASPPKELRIWVGYDKLHHSIIDTLGNVVTILEDSRLHIGIRMLEFQMQSVLYQPGFQELTRLVVEVEKEDERINRSVSHYMWQLVLRRLKHLRCLEVRHTTLPDVMRALGDFEFETDPKDGVRPCEGLEVLRLASPHDSEPDEQVEVIEMLSQVLRWRNLPGVSGSFVTEVELGLWLGSEEPLPLDIDGHLGGWRNCGVERAQLWVNDALVSSFGQMSF